MKWSEKQQKGIARSYALDGVGKRDNTIWLPGDELCCVKEARNIGIIGQGTKCTFVERNTATVTSIRNYVDVNEWDVRPTVHEGHLHTMPYPGVVDYAFFDFLGNFDLRTAQWMSNLQIASGGIICITHACGWRTNKWMYQFQDMCENGLLAEQYNDLRRQHRIYDYLMALPLVIAKCVFSQYTFGIQWPVKYKDTYRSMALFRLEGFHAQKSGWPSITDLFFNPEENVMPAKTQKARSAAATKANETRRRQSAELDAKRSEAARKANVTRKAEKLKLKRSEAAHKAWATRRATG